MRFACFLCALLLAGCAAGPALKPSELNANPDAYDGKSVRVRGWLVHQFENHGIWDSKAAYETERFKQNAHPKCIGYSGPNLGDFFVSRQLVLRGVFRKELNPNVGPNGQTYEVILLGSCNHSGLKVKSGLPRQ